MRGKGDRKRIQIAEKGITPACAGKRISPCVASVSIWDHPRVCGEKINWYNLTGLVLGSPPRVRGKAFDAGKLIPFYGITPACAGKSLICGFLLPRSGDHPRVCGEKLRLLPVLLPAVGITPACAGKSSRVRLRCRCTWDHPRVCGEKHLSALRTSSMTGSPPRVRGKVVCHACVRGYLGITPACAGKSVWCYRRSFDAGDHPRVCGEKRIGSAFMLSLLGSPPRVRGKACASSWRACAAGITPACAGKS